MNAPISDNFTQTFTTLRGERPVNTGIIAVLGYAAIGDGGGGWWLYNATDTRDDNDGTIIAPDDGRAAGRWNQFA